MIPEAEAMCESLDRINEAVIEIRRINMEDGNTVALNQKIMSDRDESASEAQERMDKIFALASEKMQNAAFVIEAISELPEPHILQIGGSIPLVRQYAFECATKEIDG